MEHFLRGRPQLWLWKFNSKEKRKFVFVFLFLVWVNVSMFQGATDIIIGIGRYIGFADIVKALLVSFRYRTITKPTLVALRMYYNSIC